MTPPRILVVDDNRDMARGVAMLLGELPAEVAVAYRGDEAAERLTAGSFDLLISDVRMPGRDGLELLDLVVQRWPQVRVVLMTAYGAVQSAVDAMRRGASDYVTKPFDNEELMQVVKRTLGLRWGEGDVRRLRGDLGEAEEFEGIVGRDPQMLAVFDMIRRVAATDLTVLISGEHGTGKELVARALHRRSGRRGAFVAFNAAALPETLAEAELFGHRRGAFTGADQDRKGHFLAAEAGTLFIDEVACMSSALQAKLLRVLQEREVMPVGSSTPVRADARVIAATNLDLGPAAREGRFREDLYYRLSGIRIRLPALRERPEDVPLLAERFVRARCGELGGEDKRLSPRTLRVLASYPWPGNVRELQNVIDRAILFAPGSPVEPEHILLDELRAPLAEAEGETYEAAKRKVVERFQRQFVERLLAECGGNLAEAARRAGLTRAALHRILKRLGLGAGPRTG